MSEYIKKEDALFKKWQFKFKDVDGEHWFVNVKDIESLPTYSFPEREKGEWIIGVWDKCSVCGTEYSEDIYNISYESDYRPNFCPNCGADMRGKAK